MKASSVGFNPEYAEVSPTEAELHDVSGDALLEFGASWCGHCQAGERALQAAMADYPELLHIKVADGKGKKLGRSFQVKLWPTLILLRNGEEVARLVRPIAAEDIHQLLAGNL